MSLSLALEIAQNVLDPEVPVLTIADLGVLREVKQHGNGFEVIITPTYSGCPAMSMIALEIELSFEKASLPRPKITTVYSPPWTTEWMSEEGKEKLKRFGIAPPLKAQGRRALFGVEEVPCPHCNSHKTTCISQFGSTSCKALWRCLTCLEPFDYFKCHA